MKHSAIKRTVVYSAVMVVIIAVASQLAPSQGAFLAAAVAVSCAWWAGILFTLIYDFMRSGSPSIFANPQHRDPR